MAVNTNAVTSTVALFLSLAFTHCAAQSVATEHTTRLDDPKDRPAATLDDVAWLVGSWSGNAFGQRFEQVWSPPSAGSMVGTFKLFSEEGVNFYELLLLIEEEGSLAIRVKHFTREFVAWEEKDDYVSFPLVRIDDGALHFSGLSFYRTDDETMEAYLAMRGKDGIREEKLVYRRSDYAALKQ